MRRVLALSAVLAVSISGTALAGSIVRTIPGPDGGWDYARVDPVSHRLFVARADSVTVVDLTGRAPFARSGRSRMAIRRCRSRAAARCS